ncbi:MAG: CAP domain-containing protein [Planctomycetes bacterium]|nr:CAP domain-containing protein [Planctomycetota bacterium]
MKRIYLLGLLALCLLAGCDGQGSKGSSGSGGSHAPAAGATATEAQLAADVLVLVNQERANVGAPALTWNGPLAAVAQAHSADMAARNFFAHNNPDGQTPFDRMAAAGITYTAAAENIAAGYAEANAVMNGWMNSPGHKTNILNATYTEIGIGVKQGGSFGTYWTQNFIHP